MKSFLVTKEMKALAYSIIQSHFNCDARKAHYLVRRYMHRKHRYEGEPGATRFLCSLVDYAMCLPVTNHGTIKEN